ncbi:SMI1/KNR4 family protein [Amycolatopsis sp. SID8362]|uniref:SMI1/KNR4 family protein n=1 Tax=Amycolatopsis sp. SID8362 TaxID=2690346 RepID=UPI001372099C|nr:SMI1/KNR4 family protein [Amycolatopsis sp. SID8362]NBH09270.1 SMI1/KNR4 family protein [Amycolatopsis sp. SID8362]NED45963.1 SMI1/KNR4 family protein [Amycolatopsis sp. SID8362]
MNPGESEYAAIAAAMAENLRTGAGAGWTTATLQLRHTGGAVSCTAWSDVRDCLRVDYTSIARRLFELPPAVLEVRLDVAGAYRFTARPDVTAVSPGQLVFDPDFRYPGHPLPGLPRPAAAEPTGAPTDPRVRAEIFRLTAEYAEAYARIKGAAPPWPAGKTEAELAAAEARMGVRLPEDLRALYLVADGDPQETGLLGPYSHDPLDHVVANYLEGEPGSYGWEDGLDDDGVVFETVPFGHVKRLSRNDWWITFGGDRAMNYVAVDVDPAARGHAGQVLEYGRDIYGPLRYVATSVTAMLTEVLTALRAGRFEDPGEQYLIAETELREAAERSYNEVISKAAELDLPSVVAELPGRELVQEVYLNDAADVDLAVFGPLTALRRLSVNRATAVTASIGGLAALESAEIEAESVDLAGLAAHPVLWDLRLEGVQEPLDLGVLRTLPRLTRLHLAGSAVPDLGQVADLPGLRVLGLDAGQVRRLLDLGRPLPRLAALFVSGRTTLPEMAELRTAFAGDQHSPVTEFSAVLP